MLRSYRGIVVALIGLTLIGAAPRPGVEPKRNQPATEQPRQPNLDRIAAALEKLPQSAAPDTGCKPGQDNRQSDLCAQWKAADAARDAAFWTMLAFFAGLVGLGIGSFTLVFAARAAHWAKEAAEQTKRAANVAQGSHDSFVASERAMLVIPSVQCRLKSEHPDEFGLEISVTNSGKTMAHIKGIGWHIADAPYFPEKTRYETWQSSVVPPSDGFAQLPLLPVDMEGLDRAWAMGWVAYHCMGQDFKSHFADELTFLPREAGRQFGWYSKRAIVNNMPADT